MTAGARPIELRSKGNDGEDCKNSRPEKGHGYNKKHGLPEVQQAHPDCEAGEGPRAWNTGWGLHLLFRV